MDVLLRAISRWSTAGHDAAATWKFRAYASSGIPRDRIVCKHHSTGFRTFNCTAIVLAWDHHNSRERINVRNDAWWVVLLLVNGLQMGAQVIASLASMDIAEIADPTSQESSTVIAQVFTWLALAIFLMIGGHRALLRCCVDTFQVYPAGGVLAEEYWLLHANEMIHHAAGIGIRAAAPAAIALILANLTTALLGRTLPQLNIMAIGFNINVLVMLWVLMASIGIVGFIYQNELVGWIEKTNDLFMQAAHGNTSEQADPLSSSLSAIEFP